MIGITRFQIGDKIGGRFQVHKVMTGGMAEVYLCLTIPNNIPFALKTLKSEYATNSNFREAFKNEIAIWISLENHPNIVRCFRLEVLDNQPFVLLEWVPGKKDRGTSLRNWINPAWLDLKTSLQITVDICYGFIHAISKQPNLVHSDINPNNILISTNGVAKITDFGLSTIKGRFTGGTAPYKAPEQWLEEKLDFRTDIYAIGCTFYEMLVGHPPFIEKNESKLQKAQLNSSVPTIKLNEQSKRINEVLLKCLGKKRGDRFNSFQELLDKLLEVYELQFKKSPRIISTELNYLDFEYVERGATYDSLQLYDLALEDYKSAIEINPFLASAYNNRGTTYLNLKKFDQAISEFEKAIKLEPSLAMAFLNLGISFHKISEFEKAKQAYENALKLDSFDPLIYYNRSITYESESKFDRALSDLTKAIEINPKYAQALNNRGSLYDDMGQHNKALVDYTQAISLDPTLTEAYNNRGTIYYHWGDFTKALKDYNLAISIDVNDDCAYYNRGNTHLRLNQINEALDDLNTAIMINPKYWQAYKNIGSILKAIGKIKEAQYYFNKAEQLRE